ncbi:MAG: hypothetical protein ACI8TP_003983 [Acidimicrobiales bacterium]|jgi:hypothetical protein
MRATRSYTSTSRAQRSTAERRARVTTSSGFPLWLREVTGDDRPLLVEGFRALAPQSRQDRFFTGANQLSESTIDHLLDVGIRSHIALVAFESPECPTAQAVGAVQFVASRYSRSGIEFALTVADQFNRRGIGSRLVSSISRMQPSSLSNSTRR